MLARPGHRRPATSLTRESQFAPFWDWRTSVILRRLPDDSTWPLSASTEAGYVVPYSISHGGAWKAFKEALVRAGLNPEGYALHSGRVGSHVAMVEADLSLHDREHQGRLAPGSKMPHRYGMTAANKKLTERTSAVLTLEPRQETDGR